MGMKTAVMRASTALGERVLYSFLAHLSITDRIFSPIFVLSLEEIVIHCSAWGGRNRYTDLRLERQRHVEAHSVCIESRNGNVSQKVHELMHLSPALQIRILYGHLTPEIIY